MTFICKVCIIHCRACRSAFAILVGKVDGVELVGLGHGGV